MLARNMNIKRNEFRRIKTSCKSKYEQTRQLEEIEDF